MKRKDRKALDLKKIEWVAFLIIKSILCLYYMYTILCVCIHFHMVIYIAIILLLFS